MTDHADPRPRPQYGEYATPEEQRARIRQPEASEQLSAGVTPASAPPSPAAPPTTAAARPTRAADRIITFALLGYGLFTVLGAAPQLFDVAAFAETMFRTVGVDAQLTDPDGARVWGIAAAVVLIGGWLLTAWLSWLSLRAGRVSWWIPLVGGIVFNMIAGTLMLIPIMNDPAAWEAMQRSIGG